MTSPFSNEILMTPDGLVVNAFRDAAGRGDYFSGSSGTSEGQFLFILGMLDAYVATGNQKSLELAERALSNVLVTVYRNTPIPDVVTDQKIFAPHWLFAAKYGFRSAVIEYDYQVTFVNGIGTIPLDTVRYVYNARSLDGVYLWNNPYSSLTAGTLYPVASYTYVEGSGMRVTLKTPYNGPLKVTFSSQTGPEVAAGEPYEAWPDWRKLDSSEIECAVDVFIWAYRAFQKAFEVTKNDTWKQAARATLQQAAISVDINDGRDWLKPTWTDSPFSDGSRFSHVDRSPPPGFGVDKYGRVQIDVPMRLSGTGDVQYGKASIGDVYASSDQTTIEIESNKAVVVRFYLDQQQTYNESRRFYKDLSLTGNGPQTITLSRTDFKNSAGAVLPSNSPVYTAALQMTASVSHTVWIKRVRQTPPRDIMYYPGAIPFTANFLGSPPMQIDWRGPIYAGYQSPHLWVLLGNLTAAATCCQLLRGAQAAWKSQTGLSQNGPFAPVFYFNRDDAVQYGTKNTFGWNGPDPNTKWGGYQYRPLVELAETIVHAPQGTAAWNLASSACEQFLSWLADPANWPEGSGPPTDFPITGPERNYKEPHMAALILRAMLLRDGVIRPNGDNTIAMTVSMERILSRCISLWDSLYVESGVMAGTFSNDPEGHEWFGFWHGEILSTLSLLKEWGSRANTNVRASRAPLVRKAEKWIAGMINWADANSPVADSPWGSKLWPFEHDWASPVSETYEFSTNILTSFDGHEQRISRRNHPRRGLTYQHTLYRQKDAADYQALLRSAQNRPFLIPQWHTVITVDEDAVSGNSYLSITHPVDMPLKAGSPVVLVSGQKRQVNYIKMIEGVRITLREILLFDMPAGSRILPAYMGVLNSELSATRPTAASLEVQTSVALLPQEDRRKLPVRDDEQWMKFVTSAGNLWSSYIKRAAALRVEQPRPWPLPGPLDVPVPTFTAGGETREVVSRKPNWISQMSVQDSWVYDVIDYFSGPVTPMEGENVGRKTIQARWSMFTADDQKDVLSMLGRLRGMQIACWLPSGCRDFEMTRDTPRSNLRRLYVQNNAIIEEGLLSDSTVCIVINTRLNSHICVRATSFTKGNEESAITLDRDLPWPLKRSEVVKISLLYRVRQASDRAEVTWLSPSVAEVQMSFVTVQE